MPGGFDEDQSRFTGALALADYFAAWDYACAFTGQSLRDLIDADPLTALLRLTPQSELRADLVLPASPEVSRAYHDGAIAVGADFGLILRPGALRNPGLLQQLNPDYRLRLPRDLAFAPNRLVLREHCRALLDPG